MPPGETGKELPKKSGKKLLKKIGLHSSSMKQLQEFPTAIVRFSRRPVKPLTSITMFPNESADTVTVGMGIGERIEERVGRHTLPGAVELSEK